MPSFLAQLTGSFSTPAAGNPTVAMIEAAFRHHRLHWRYINCEVRPEDLADAVRGARAMGWAGFNCSLPHKVEVIRHLDGLGESAAIMGAVNCAVRRGDAFIGENTDGKGFLASLQAVASPVGQRIAVLGAGGAARAVAVELALAGARTVTIVNRDTLRGEDLANLLTDRTRAHARFVQWRGRWAVPYDVDILVNCTSVGLYPDVEERLDLDISSLRPGLIVADVVPSPPRTHLVQDAERAGCTVIDGLGMLVNQGVLGIKYWTGVDVDPAPMRAKLAEIYGV